MVVAASVDKCWQRYKMPKCLVGMHDFTHNWPFQQKVKTKDLVWLVASQIDDWLSCPQSSFECHIAMAREAKGQVGGWGVSTVSLGGVGGDGGKGTSPSERWDLNPPERERKREEEKERLISHLIGSHVELSRGAVSVADRSTPTPQAVHKVGTWGGNIPWGFAQLCPKITGCRSAHWNLWSCHSNPLTVHHQMSHTHAHPSQQCSQN